ncbi:MAG TPA: HAD family hydrolase, partial [Myxococcales bacterium]|nr:HAD family hydrolase [Myxococcales bacterium]
YLQPYRGVVETLRKLKELEVPVVALTDAPRNPAERRALRMKLDGLLTALYTLPAFPFPDSGIDPEIRKREEAGGIQLGCPVYELPRELEKPNPAGLLRICADLGLEPSEVVFVGDSLTKDVRVARETGALDCWAEYGTYVSAEYLERLAIISAPSATRRHLRHAPDDRTGRPTVRLSCFEQVLEVVMSSRVGAERAA